MRIGILSDSHGKHERTAAAVELLVDQGAEVLIHLGDLCSDAVVDALVLGPSGPPVHIVYGNCDTRFVETGRYAASLGIVVDEWEGRLDADGKTVAYTHGHLIDVMQKAVADGADYLLHGHTHETRDERVGETRIINPGALQRARRYTVAVLDTASDVLDFHAVNG